jgi:hypothetical protein
MNTMKRIAVMVAVFVLLSGAGVCFAESAIPSLAGTTWIVKSEAGMLLRGDAAGPKTHHSSEFSTLTAEAVVTKQQGRVIHGVFKSPKATENFVAVIGYDNKSFYLADEDGTMEGKIVSKNKIETIYRHVTATDTVIAAGVWTRKK